MKVVILGAGASKECGLPLGWEIWKFLCPPFCPKPDWLDFLEYAFDVRVEELRNSRFYPTVESVLSLIDYCIKDGKGLGEYSCNDLVGISSDLKKDYVKSLAQLCLYTEYKYLNGDGSTLQADNVYAEFNNWYQPFFEKLMEESRGDTAFISINYDTLPDLALKKALKIGEQETLDYGVAIYNLNEQDKRCDKKGPLLLKPNGSINFVWCHKCFKVFTESDSTQGKTGNTPECNNCNESMEPLINFPPYKNPEPLIAIHQKISEVISKADEILVVGYSLPDYDTHILDAFLSGAMANKNRQALRLEIVDKINDEDKGKCLLEKYRHIFCEPKSPPQWGGFKKYAEDFLVTSSKISAEQN